MKSCDPRGCSFATVFCGLCKTVALLQTVQLGQRHLERGEWEQLKLPYWCSYRYNSCRYVMLRKMGSVANRYESCVVMDEGTQHWLVYKVENCRVRLLYGPNESAPSLLVQPPMILSSLQRPLLSPQSSLFFGVLSKVKKTCSGQ